VSLLRLLPRSWQRRIRNYAPRGFRDAASCGAFYDARSRLFCGDEAAVLEYSSLDVQRRLFERAVAALPPHGRVLDVGCGLGHLVDFLEERGFPVSSYHGIDVSVAMIEAARSHLGEEKAVSFEIRDLTQSGLPENGHDVGYIISVLGYPIGPEPMTTMMQMLRTAFSACTDGLVFTHIMDGRRERPLAFPTIPEELASRCECELGAKATIHDDGADFTYLISLRRRTR